MRFWDLDTKNWISEPILNHVNRLSWFHTAWEGNDSSSQSVNLDAHFFIWELILEIYFFINSWHSPAESTWRLRWISKLTLAAVSCLEQLISFIQPFCWWKFAGFHRLKGRRDAVRQRAAWAHRIQLLRMQRVYPAGGTLDGCREEITWHPVLSECSECWQGLLLIPQIHSFTLNFSSRWQTGRLGKLTLQGGCCDLGSAVTQGQSCSSRWGWKKLTKFGVGQNLSWRLHGRFSLHPPSSSSSWSPA